MSSGSSPPLNGLALPTGRISVWRAKGTNSGGTVKTGHAEGEGTIGPSGSWDQARAEVSFDSGFVARFDASRMAEGRKRTMRVVYPSGEVEIDFVARTFRNTTPFELNPDFADTPAGTDPLGASVEGFLQAVRGEAPRPIVNAEEAIRALDLALAVERALEDAA